MLDKCIFDVDHRYCSLKILQQRVLNRRMNRTRKHGAYNNNYVLYRYVEHEMKADLLYDEDKLHPCKMANDLSDKTLGSRLNALNPRLLDLAALWCCSVERVAVSE